MIVEDDMANYVYSKNKCFEKRSNDVYNLLILSLIKSVIRYNFTFLEVCHWLMLSKLLILICLYSVMSDHQKTGLSPCSISFSINLNMFRSMAGLMAVASFLSTWINNSTSTSIKLPVALAVTDKLENHSKNYQASTLFQYYLD